MTELRQIRRALISVSDKGGVAELAATLIKLGIELISTGGTANALRENGIRVTDVSEVTGYPEMLDGRVKTLHPKIHGAFLGLRNDPEHVRTMKEFAIEPIDMVVVNLYPFERTVARPDVDLSEAVETIDIGGPAMIRSAAKNWKDVAVVTDIQSYKPLIAELEETGGYLSLETRSSLAATAFRRTAAYDLAIAEYLSHELNKNEPGKAVSAAAVESAFPRHYSVELAKVTDLRYGENPHQTAALYAIGDSAIGIGGSQQLHGKEMSYNNYVDSDAAWNLVQEFDTRAVAIIKHTNPSGLGVGSTNDEAYHRALSTDPVSAFGGVVAFNTEVDEATARSVTEVFTEVIVAPDFDPGALKLLGKKKNLRVVKVESSPRSSGRELEYKTISGGMLVQSRDVKQISPGDLTVVTKVKPSSEQIEALLLAWKVCKHVKSNAIVFANRTQTLGVGAGQMNRVDSVRIAALRASRFNLTLDGAVLASDAFFPFRDNIDEAAKHAISSIIQPGGSVKDNETIAAADEHGISMVFTGIRHFKH